MIFGPREKVNTVKRLLTGTIILLLTMLWLASVANDPNKTSYVP